MKRVIVLVLFLLTACSEPVQLEQGIVLAGDQEIYVFVADTNQERKRGLMDIKEMAPDRGMLFVFEGEQPRSFWMKNTLIPLDAYHLNRNWEAVERIQMEPCSEDPCKVYKATQPAKYVLELNKGAYDFEEGMVLKFEQ